MGLAGATSPAHSWSPPAASGRPQGSGPPPLGWSPTQGGISHPRLVPPTRAASPPPQAGPPSPRAASPTPQEGRRAPGRGEALKNLRASRRCDLQKRDLEKPSLVEWRVRGQGEVLVRGYRPGHEIKEFCASPEQRGLQLITPNHVPEAKPGRS